MDMLSQMLCRVDTAMLTTCAAEAEHERREATLDIAAHVSISQSIDGVEEGQYLTVVLQEADDRLIESCQLLIRLITARIVGRTTVEDIAATVAALVLGNTLGEREAENANHQRSLSVVLREGGRTVLRMGLIGVQIGGFVAVGTGCRSFCLLELGQFGELGEHLCQIRIGEVALAEQLTDVLNGGRNALDEVRLTLEVATEAIGPQHLEQTEQHEERQALDEGMRCRHLGILLQGVVVLVHQFATHLMGILGRSLPQERCHVIVIRSAATTLEIDEVRLALGIEHDVTRLEVTIEEALFVVGRREVLGQQAEIGLEFQLMEVEFGSLQEAILEVVEVEQHAVGIESGLGIAVGEVEAVSTVQLDVRQLTDGATKQFLLFQGIASACLASATNGIEQGRRAEVGLQIARLVLADSQYLGYRQVLAGKMLTEIDKCVILITTGTYTTHHHLALGIGHSIVLTIATATGQLGHILGLCPTPLPIEFY